MQFAGPEPCEQPSREDQFEVVARCSEVAGEYGVFLRGDRPFRDLIPKLLAYSVALDGEPHDDDNDVDEDDAEQHQVADGSEYRGRKVESRVQKDRPKEAEHGQDDLQCSVVNPGDEADPYTRKRGERRVGEAAEDPADDERLRTEL